MALFWTRTFDALAGAFFPTACVSCGDLVFAPDPPLCPACWGALPLFTGSLCRCGSPLQGSPGEDCGRCRRGRSVLVEGASLGRYEGPLRDCVIALKYRGRHRTAARLADRLLGSERCRSVLRASDVVVGVPLHPERERRRGFNQAQLLAIALGGSTGLPVSRGLRRVRNTRTQTDLSAGERRRNVRSAFTPGPAALRGARVVLVDDVITTGATLRECALTLLAAGAREVRSITVARAE